MTSSSAAFAAAAAVALGSLCSGAEANLEARCVQRLPETRTSSPYVFNRAPLAATTLAKLPIGAIRPRGWLEGQLALMASGMVGRLDEISPFIGPASGWADPSKPGWEELPYWLKGFGDLGYVLDSRSIKSRASVWLDSILASQQSDGYFGPTPNLAAKDLWPNMVVLFAMQSLYEATGDSRVIGFMTSYFRWQNSLPITELLPESWQKVRGGDNLESVYWLYNRTGDPWLLELADKIHRQTVDWTHTIASMHGVNFCQGFREPGVFFQHSGDEAYLRATEQRYSEMMQRFGRVPGGMFAADENARDGFNGPQQGAETCSMVEYMYSFESLLRITGDPEYADKAEEVAFNSLPAAATPGWRGIHYLTAPNQVMLHKGPEQVFQNQGRMVSYSAGTAYRCCQHNVSHGWPYFAQHVWMATAGGGLAAIFYADSDVTAEAAGGVGVLINERTGYPFDETVTMTLHPEKPARFPLALRIPNWCTDAKLVLNGETLDIHSRPASYVTIERVWKKGDVLRLKLPMRLEVVRWPEHGNAVSVRRGPLWYSLQIQEKWLPFAGEGVPAAWPDQEVLPGSDWNYGLLLDEGELAEPELVSSRLLPDQPWTPDSAPIRLKVRGRKLPQWKLERNSPASPPASPAATNEPVTDLTLVPMGAARLRISVFPVAESLR